MKQGSAGDSGAGKQTPAQLPGPLASQPASDPCVVENHLVGRCEAHDRPIIVCLRGALVWETARRMHEEDRHRPSQRWRAKMMAVHWEDEDEITREAYWHVAFADLGRTGLL